jgi:hypothetical protein
MSTHTVTETDHHDHPPQPGQATQTETGQTSALHRIRPLGALDRAALHLGVALIRWGRRPAKSTRERTRRERTRRDRPTLSREAYEAHRQAEALRDEYRTMSMTQYR